MQREHPPRMLLYFVENPGHDKTIIILGRGQRMDVAMSQYIQPKAVGECSRIHDSWFTFYLIRGWLAFTVNQPQICL